MSQRFRTRGRGFLQRLAGLAGLTAAAAPLRRATARTAPGDHRYLPATPAPELQVAEAVEPRPTGGNADRWPIRPAPPRRSSTPPGPGVITHIWFTIAAQGRNHLKELVLRVYWDGNAKPSVETPVGDFFGLNLGQYSIYESAYLACSPGHVAQLLLRHAVPQVGADHRHQRRHAARRRVLFQHRLPARAVAARRHALLPRAVPPGSAPCHRVTTAKRRSSIPTARRTTSTSRRAGAAT